MPDNYFFCLISAVPENQISYLMISSRAWYSVSVLYYRISSHVWFSCLCQSVSLPGHQFTCLIISSGAIYKFSFLIVTSRDQYLFPWPFISFRALSSAPHSRSSVSVSVPDPVPDHYFRTLNSFCVSLTFTGLIICPGSDHLFPRLTISTRAWSTVLMPDHKHLGLIISSRALLPVSW